MTNGPTLTPMLLWTGTPGVDVYNWLASTWDPLQDQLDEGYLCLEQLASPTPTVLGDYWMQSLVHVKLGVIPLNKQRLVTFDFTLPSFPEPKNISVEFFVENEFQQQISFTVQELTESTRYTRGLLVDGDGVTSANVFLRVIPYEKYLYFHNVFWEDI